MFRPLYECTVISSFVKIGPNFSDLESRHKKKLPHGQDLAGSMRTRRSGVSAVWLFFSYETGRRRTTREKRAKKAAKSSRSAA